MNDEQHPTRRRTILWSSCCLVLCGACTVNTSLSMQEQYSLERRAQNLLLRAARSPYDVVRANSFEALVAVAPDAGLSSFRDALDSDSPLVRFAACCSLGDLRDKASEPVFYKHMTDADPLVKLGAAYALCRIGVSAAARELVSVMEQNPDEFLRSEAAYRIGRIGDRGAIARLRSAARRESSTRVRAFIQTALALLGDEDAVEQLMGYANFDRATQLVALQSLRELSDPRAREMLLVRLNRSEHLQTRLLAARALGAIGVDAGYRLAVDSLAFQADDPTETMQVRTNAALALGEIGNPSALSLLRRTVENETDPRTQVAVCRAICQIVDLPLGR